MYDQWLRPGSAGHYAFIAFELGLAVWILSGLAPRASAGVALMVLAVFTLLIAREMRRYDPRPCGCLGDRQVQAVTPGDVRAGLRASLVRNVALMGVAGWLVVVSGVVTGLRRIGSNAEDAEGGAEGAEKKGSPQMNTDAHR
jgi:hypothetical protein